VGIGRSHGVQKIGVLTNRHVVCADLIVVGHAAVEIPGSRVVGVARVPDRHEVDRDGVSRYGE
jgi:hypothetical protein